MNSWILSFSSTGTSFRPHMHGEKLFRGIGSFSSAGSRPRDMEGGGGGGHTDPVIRGGGGGLQIIFSTLRALLWSKNTGGQGPPGPSPGSANVLPAKST